MLEVGESRSLEAIGHSIGHIHMSLHITDCSNNVYFACVIETEQSRSVSITWESCPKTLYGYG